MEAGFRFEVIEDPEFARELKTDIEAETEIRSAFRCRKLKTTSSSGFSRLRLIEARSEGIHNVDDLAARSRN